MKKEPCEYCREENPECLTGGKDFGDDEFTEIKNGYIEAEIWIGAFTPNPECTTLSIPISFCPKCGRELN